MKIKSFLALGAMILALAACNKDNTPGGGNTGEISPYAGSMTVNNGTGAKEIEITIDGLKVYAFELGQTAGESGQITLTIPAGTKSISFYGMSWETEVPTIAFYPVTGDEDMEPFAVQEMSAQGTKLTGSITSVKVGANDKYTVTFEDAADEDMFAIVKTASAAHVLLFGFENTLEESGNPEEPTVQVVSLKLKDNVKVTTEGPAAEIMVSIPAKNETGSAIAATITGTKDESKTEFPANSLKIGKYIVNAVDFNGTATINIEAGTQTSATKIFVDDAKLEANVDYAMILTLTEVTADVATINEESKTVTISYTKSGELPQLSFKLSGTTSKAFSSEENVKRIVAYVPTWPTSRVNITLTKAASEDADTKAFPDGAITMAASTYISAGSSGNGESDPIAITLDPTKVTETGTYAIVITGTAAGYKDATITLTYTKEESQEDPGTPSGATITLSKPSYSDFEEDGNNMCLALEAEASEGYVGDLTLSIDDAATPEPGKTLLTSAEASINDEGWSNPVGTLSFTTDNSKKGFSLAIPKANLTSGTSYQIVIKGTATGATVTPLTINYTAQ